MKRPPKGSRDMPWAGWGRERPVTVKNLPVGVRRKCTARHFERPETAARAPSAQVWGACRGTGMRRA